MRDAALTIAALGDDYALSFAERLARRLALGLDALRRRHRAYRHLRQLRRLDARLLDDLGLVPDDLAALAEESSALAATRRLAERVAARRAEERWARR